jgi:two-component system response regulator DctR
VNISTSKQMPRKNLIYLVEDDVDLANAMRMLFQTEGLDIEHFSDGESFLKKIEAHQILSLEEPAACVLLDIRLGSMSGLEVFDKLRKSHRHFKHPVIFLTGHADLQVAVDVMRQGAVDFVTKPFDSDTLIGKVRNSLLLSNKTLDTELSKQQLNMLLDRLTDKELKVMQYVIEGMHNREIAEILGNSVRTVEIHRANVFDKMEVKSAVELARLLERYGYEH